MEKVATVKVNEIHDASATMRVEDNALLIGGTVSNYATFNDVNVPYSVT